MTIILTILRYAAIISAFIIYFSQIIKLLTEIRDLLADFLEPR